MIYLTSLSTLTKLPGTILAYMFSGRYNLVQDENGNYFLDRDGNLFRYILNYIRTSQVPELSDNELKLLREEAEFFFYFLPYDGY